MYNCTHRIDTYKKVFSLWGFFMALFYYIRFNNENYFNDKYSTLSSGT